MSCRRYRSLGLALDIDTIEDLTYFVSLKAKETYAYKMLEKIEVANKLERRQRSRKD
jgi:2-phospho-L-lactate guanylyltransferase (CobY/MobA/RfbA family)